MYSERLLDHFRNPRNVGELRAPAITVEASNPACGDILRLGARFESGRVAAAAYKTRGCTASIAAGSALTEWMLGKTPDELGRFSTDQLDSALGGVAPESRHALALCGDALSALLRRAGEI